MNKKKLEDVVRTAVKQAALQVLEGDGHILPYNLVEFTTFVQSMTDSLEYAGLEFHEAGECE